MLASLPERRTDIDLERNCGTKDEVFDSLDGSLGWIYRS